MEIREVRQSDTRHIREVTRESLTESYGHEFDEKTVEAVATAWYGDDTIEDLLSDEQSLFITATNDEMYGYAEGEVLAGEIVVGDIHWLHVRPDARGEGFGSQLLGEVVDRMAKEGATLVRGRVIEPNEGGATFYEEHGFERSSSEIVDIQGEKYEELVYEKRLDESALEILREVEGPDGQELYVDYTAGETGVIAPLYPTYLDDNLEEQYGWLCSNCGSKNTTMDSAGRIQCANCDNGRKATRWDESYL